MGGGGGGGVEARYDYLDATIKWYIVFKLYYRLSEYLRNISVKSFNCES